MALTANQTRVLDEYIKDIYDNILTGGKSLRDFRTLVLMSESDVLDALKAFADTAVSRLSGQSERHTVSASTLNTRVRTLNDFIAEQEG